LKNTARSSWVLNLNRALGVDANTKDESAAEIVVAVKVDFWLGGGDPGGSRFVNQHWSSQP
jgi:hypothetical protein